jgi:hypothetical protein
MVYVKQGSSTNLFATFQDVIGVETASSTTPKITIIHVDNTGSTITDVDNQDMTLVSGTTGQYYYTWGVSSSAYTGSYSITYSGTVSGKSLSANETITVLESGTSPESGDNYCTTLQAVRFSGIGVEVQKELLGVGDSTEDSYDTKNGNIINSSYKLYYGASNDLLELIEDDDFYLSLDDGRILLTPTGVTKVDEKNIYIDYTYSPKHSNSLLTSYLPIVDSEVDKLTNNHWGSAKDSVQYFDGYDDGYPRTDRPFGEDIDNHPELVLKYKGVNSITSVEFLDYQGNTMTTLDSDEYRIMTDDDYQESRLIILRPLINGTANIKVTFNSGYTNVPNLVQELASYVAGKMALVNISGGSYKDVSTYSIGSKSFSIGMIYINVESSLKRIQERIDDILNMLGGNLGCA